MTYTLAELAAPEKYIPIKRPFNSDLSYYHNGCYKPYLSEQLRLRRKEEAVLHYQQKIATKTEMGMVKRPNGFCTKRHLQQDRLIGGFKALLNKLIINPKLR